MEQEALVYLKKNIKVDIYVGTLSKSLGSYGGFICAKKKNLLIF